MLAQTQLFAPGDTSLRMLDGATAFALLDRNGVPCELTAPEFGPRVFDDPHLAATERTVRLNHPRLGSFEHFGRTIDFSDTVPPISGPPPLCGQHTRELLLEAGLEEAEIDKLVECRAVFEELWVE